jgi:RNA polymerase sigma factor (sigma-70 family)
MTAADFNRLVIKHENQLRPFAISLTRNPEDARDLYQETMLRALVNRDRYQFGTNLKAWLFTIMRNIFINNYRRRKKGLINELTGPHEQIPDQARNDGWSRLRTGEIEHAVNQLPSAYRVSFELYHTGYKYQEIADLLEEPLGTIKSRIHFARKTLVGRLER